MAVFPTEHWLNSLMEKLNNDEQYSRIARNWEGDMLFHIEPNGAIKQDVIAYLDLWHGKCRQVRFLSMEEPKEATIMLKAPYQNFLLVLNGSLDPMQALLTRKLGVKGSMTKLMGNVPTVLDFVRCCREITTGYV